MTDKEKVIKGLTECVTAGLEKPCPLDCQYFQLCFPDVGPSNPFMSLMQDALDLLKKQEAKPMTEYDDGWDCPRCGLKLIGKTASGYPCNELDLPNDEIVKYCPVCGQAVKLDD